MYILQRTPQMNNNSVSIEMDGTYADYGTMKQSPARDAAAIQTTMQKEVPRENGICGPKCASWILCGVIFICIFTTMTMLVYAMVKYTCEGCDPSLPPVSVAIAAMRNRNCTQVALIMPESCYDGDFVPRSNYHRFLRRCSEWIDKLTATDPSLSAEILFRGGIHAEVVQLSLLIWRVGTPRENCE